MITEIPDTGKLHDQYIQKTIGLGWGIQDWRGACEILLEQVVILENRVQATESEIESLLKLIGTIAEQQGEIIAQLESKEGKKK